MIIDTFELEKRKDQSELREWNWPWENQIFNILKYNPRNLLFIQRIYKDPEIRKTDEQSQTNIGIDKTVRVWLYEWFEWDRATQGERILLEL